MKGSTRIVTDHFRKSWSSQSLLKSEAQKKPHELRKLRKKKHSKSQYFPIKQLLSKDKEKIFLISPESIPKLFWDICCISITISQAFIIPYLISFTLNLSYEIRTYLEVSNILLIIDIPISMNTSLYNKGKLVTDRKTILKFYLRTYFFIDLWSILPFQLLFVKEKISLDLKLTVVILLLKLLRIVHMRTLFFSIEDYWSSPTSVFLTRLLYFFIVFSLLCHWLCCFMEYLLTISMKDHPEDWVLYRPTEYKRYLHQFYIIILTMTSVGYESPRKALNHNLLGTVLVMCIESLIFAFTLGEIQSIVSKYTYYSSQTKDIIFQIKRLLDKKNIPKSLRLRIIRYVNYMREVEKDNAGKEIELLWELSQPLKIEIFTFTRVSYLENHAIFQNYSPGFIKFIGFNMKIMIFSRGDLVLLEGEKGSSIYFIINGSVDIYSQSTKTIYKSLGKSKSFGELGFFVGICRTASARCDSFTELVSLDRETFNRLLSDHPSEQDITKEILKRAEKDLSILGIKCFFCKKLTHIAKDCKDALIKLHKDKIMHKAVNKRNKLGGIRVNLAYNIDKKFMRPEHESDVIKNYAIFNVKSHVCNSPSLKVNTSLAKKARRYVSKLNEILPLSIKKLRLVQESDDDSRKSEKNFSVLPKGQRYIENFICSRKKTDEEIPKIVINGK